jgi:8-oxo-dGTP pyrophosphatase MutT (NUDIX family)
MTRRARVSDRVEEEVAAGGIIFSARDGEEARVLLVHRPKYDDWSFPKGKAEEGESLEETALREVREETGLDCRIIRRLDPVRYRYRSRKGALRDKAVHYYVMRPDSSGGAAEPEPVANREVDRFEWLAPSKASGRLSYEADRDALRLI